MPLEQRVVEPICISRGTLPLESPANLIPNELECVTNGSLANVIRELSSLSRFAEDVFGGICLETNKLISRTSTLQGRIDRLAIKSTQLDSSVEEVSIHDLHLKKPFKSSSSYDQQVVSRTTIPASLLDQYKMCDTPPPLSKLNVYRDDKKDGLKFYTDPNYFFELWRQEMLQMSERESVRTGSKKVSHRTSSSSKTPPNGVVSKDPSQAALTATANRTKKPRQPANTRERYQMQAAQQEFLPGVTCSPSGHSYPYPPGQQNGGIYTTAGAYGTLQRPNSLEINQYGMIENPYGVHPSVAQQQQQHHHAMMMQQQRLAQQQHEMTAQYGYISGNNMQQHNYNRDYGQQEMQQHTPPIQGQSTPTHRKGTPSSRPNQPPPAPPSNPASSNSSSGQATPTGPGTPSRGNSRGTSVNREVLPPPPPPPMPGQVYDNSQQGILGIVNGDHTDSLPPPPMSSAQPIMKANGTHDLPNNNKSHNQRQLNTCSGAAPPPPPPLPSEMGSVQTNSVSKPSPPTFAQQIQAKHSQLQPPSANKMSNRLLPPHAAPDTRSSLLAAIREGIKLRRVEDHKAKEVEKSAPCNDVASILARRVPQELSDSDSEGGNNSGFESDAWDDS